jgi:hypothetical protein
LTNAELTAWVPHLGNWQRFHPHIPPAFHHLISPVPLEDNYNGVPPAHPLPQPVPILPPPVPIQTLLQGMGSMSIASRASGPSGSRFVNAQAGPSGSRRTTSDSEESRSESGLDCEYELPENRKLLFVESPRVWGVPNARAAQGLVSYNRLCVDQKTPRKILHTIRTAPPGFAFLEEEEEDDRYKAVKSYMIHDMVRV